MTTATTMIYKSLRLLGVLQSGEAPTAAEAQDMLDGLNSIIDAYAANPQYYFCVQDEAFSCVAAQANYCIGNESLAISALTCVTTTATATTVIPHGLQTGNKVTVSGAVESNYNVTAAITVTSPTVFTYTIVNTTSPATGTPVLTAGDFYTVRPIRVIGAFTRASNVDSPLGVVTEQYWTNLADKNVAAAVPTKLLYRPNYPFGQVILYGVPSGTPVLHLKTEKRIQQYANLTIDQLLPPGYRRLLELSLAIDTAAEYGAKVSQEVVAFLKADLASLIKTNMQSLQTSKVGEAATQQAAA